MNVSLNPAVIRPRASGNQRKKFGRALRHVGALDAVEQAKLNALRAATPPKPAWQKVLDFKARAATRRQAT
jgi:hypothetical protein